MAITPAGAQAPVPSGLGQWVLITRPEPGASETAARVLALGFAPLLAPMLRIGRADAALPEPHKVAAVLATSGNAIAALPSAWHTTRLFAVGDATAARARAAGFGAVASAAGDAAALATLVAQALDPQDGPLLLASGRGQGQALAAALRQAQFRVIRRVVYAALPVPDLPPAAAAALRARQVRAALFFSAETARVFVRLIRRAGLADALAAVDAIPIGQPAAMALRTLPWRDIRVAARPNQDAMLCLLR